MCKACTSIAVSLTDIHLDRFDAGDPAEPTLLTASRKSFSVTVFRRARMANMPASVQTLLMSAPVLLGHKRAMSSKRMSRSQFMVRVCIWKICVLLSKSGSPNSTCRGMLAQQDLHVSSCR